MTQTLKTNAVPFGDLSREYSALKSEIDGALSRVLGRGRFILGEELEHFEKSFASYIGVAECVGVASGTDAVALSLRAVGVEAGDEVLTVSYTAAPTGMAITQIGAIPRFVDIDENCLMDASKIERAITKKTKAIVPVHMYGQCVDMDAVMAVASRAKIAVVEDCAHAHGALYKNRKAGTIGDAGAFSFYPTKNLGCYGDGGAVTSNRPEVTAKIRSLRNYGQTTRGRYEFKGVNSRLDEVQAAILIAKLPHLDEWNQKRRRLAARYSAALAGLPLTLPQDLPGRFSVHHLYVVHTPQREALRKHLVEQGIESSDHYAFPLHLFDAYRDIGSTPEPLPVTVRKASESLSLPFHPYLLDEEIDTVAKSIRRFFSK